MTATASKTTAGETRYALYRFFGERMELLYVGITNDPWRRQRQHAREKPWYPQAKHFAVTFHDTEAEARKAELKAIRGEAPRFNIADMPGPVPAGFTVRWLAAIAVCSAWMLLAILPAIPIGIWHLRWLATATAPVLVSGLVPTAGLGLLLFTSQIRDLMAWIDHHVVEVQRPPAPKIAWIDRRQA